MKWEAFAHAARRSKFRYSDGEVTPSASGPLPPSVQLLGDLLTGGLLTFSLTPEEAEALAGKLADAAAAARAMPVEERVYDLGRTKAEVEGRPEPKAGGR
jgi:hypothetical protein